ncbi:large ribosomal subunit protein mL54-like isoform X2 [Acipenser ruthenus]|uniref:large ribosomal subunit protein mL54-like isoform X2 n=1 Tax=Acipenser ruthenus TaxID=7906 RepID=UPI0027420744|nr:large ribosomal subunit protein mL54-like isoform X2 [Acipenser ruthenus]
MSGIALFGTVRGLRLILSSTLPKILACGYAKKVAAKGKGKGMAKDAQKGPEVCKDPVKLTTHAMGVNIYKEGQDPPLQAASEYPEWLFQLDLGPPKQLSELDPENREYWKLMRKEHMWRFNKLHKGKKL